MGSFSIWHWLVVLLYIVVIQWPLWRIAKKAGYPGALSLLLLIPLVNFVAIWVFAIVKWPVEKRAD